MVKTSLTERWLASVCDVGLHKVGSCQGGVGSMPHAQSAGNKCLPVDWPASSPEAAHKVTARLAGSGDLDDFTGFAHDKHGVVPSLPEIDTDYVAHIAIL